MLTRRDFVVAGAAIAGTVAFPAFARANGRQVAVYRLEPFGACGGAADGACSACILHAAHNLFPTAKAANGNRAHGGCNCCVTAGELDFGTFVALFGRDVDQPRRFRVDTRTQSVAAMLQRHPPSFA